MFGNYSVKDLTSQYIYDMFLQKGVVKTGNEKDSNWKGLLFEENGKVKMDVGNQKSGFNYSEFWGTRWTDGWIISNESRTKSHAYYYKTQDREFIFLELKNGDYNRGRAPLWMVFSR